MVRQYSATTNWCIICILESDSAVFNTSETVTFLWVYCKQRAGRSVCLLTSKTGECDAM